MKHRGLFLFAEGKTPPVQNNTVYFNYGMHSREIIKFAPGIHVAFLFLNHHTIIMINSIFWFMTNTKVQCRNYISISPSWPCVQIQKGRIKQLTVTFFKPQNYKECVSVLSSDSFIVLLSLYTSAQRECQPDIYTF